MKALLLAAGYGTRLKPLTDNIPKCLVPIAKKPLLEYWLENLKGNGINKILVNTHYKHEQVINFIRKSDYSNIVKIVYEDTLLGTAGTLFKNIDFFEDEDAILIHADNICEESLSGIINSFKNRPSNSLLTLLSFRTSKPESCGIITTDKHNIITSYVEKPSESKINLANGAIFIISNQFLREFCFSKIRGNDFCRDVLPLMIKKMNSYETKHFFIDIGTLENYKNANSYFESIQKTEM